MKKFIYKKAVCSVFLAACFSLNISAYGEKSVSQLENERGSIKSQSEKTKSALDDTQKEKSDVLKEVQKLDSELEEVIREISSLNEKLDETKKNLASTEEDLKKANSDKEKQVDLFRERIRIMYENGTEGYLEIIFESEDFADFLRRVEYADKIIEFDQEVIDRYEATERRISQDIENIKVKEEEIEKLSAEEEEKRKILDKKLEEKQTLFEKLSEDEKQYLQKLKDLENADKEIEELIQKEQARLNARKRAAAAKAQAARRKQQEESAKAAQRQQQNASNSASANNQTNSQTNSQPPAQTDSDTSSDDGKMAYPVPSQKGSAPNDVYGTRVDPISGKEEKHKGLDLKATLNADVVAALGGTVIFAGEKSGYGNTVIIDHGDGTSTLYAHNSSLNVNVGDDVKKGQVIAKAGTSGYSTGVHVHFEVRKNGIAVDPSPYLK